MTFPHLRLRLPLLLSAAILLPSAFAAELPRLAIFGNRPAAKGLWKMELLESSNKEMLKQAKAMSSMSFCMDAASEMSQKLSAPKDGKVKCESKIVKNTSSEAEMEMICPNGTKMKVSMTAESKDSYLVKTVSTPKSGEPMTMKARYMYAGACKSDALIQMDSKSPECQKIRAQMSLMDPEKACGKLTGNQKAACEGQMKSARAQMEKMCP